MKNEIKVGDLVMGESGTPGAGHAGVVYEIKHIGRHRYAFYRDDEGYVFMNLVHRLTKNVPEKGRFPRKNPVKSPRGWKIQTASANGWADVKSSDGGSYKTDYYSSKAEAQSELAELAETRGDYDSWRVVPASTRANDDIYENPVKPRRGESERDFVSRCMSEEKMKFPKQKQRIAVCLSKARRNPFPDRNLDE